MMIHDVTSHDVTYLYVNLYINVNLSIKPFPQTLGDTLVPFFFPWDFATILPSWWSIFPSKSQIRAMVDVRDVGLKRC